MTRPKRITVEGTNNHFDLEQARKLANEGHSPSSWTGSRDVKLGATVSIALRAACDEIEHRGKLINQGLQFAERQDAELVILRKENQRLRDALQDLKSIAMVGTDAEKIAFIDAALATHTILGIVRS